MPRKERPFHGLWGCPWPKTDVLRLSASRTNTELCHFEGHDPECRRRSGGMTLLRRARHRRRLYDGLIGNQGSDNALGNNLFFFTGFFELQTNGSLDELTLAKYRNACLRAWSQALTRQNTLTDG